MHVRFRNTDVIGVRCPFCEASTERTPGQLNLSTRIRCVGCQEVFDCPAELGRLARQARQQHKKRLSARG